MEIQDKKQGKNKQTKQLALWIGALILGAILGALGIEVLNGMMNFVATVYTRLFQLLAVPTIALAVITTLSSLGNQADTGKIFRHAIVYTLLTTIAAAAVGLVLYNIVAPGNLPTDMVLSGTSELPQNLEQTSYYDHILGVIPNNIIKPFAEGNVLSILLLAAAAGIALAKMPQSNKKEVVVKGLLGLQDLLFMLIRGLIWALPLGIVAFAAQLSAQFSAGIVMDSLGKYVAIILGGNVIQFFIVLPLFLLARGINPVRTLSKMMPAVLMALFTKSSAATLPVLFANLVEIEEITKAIEWIALVLKHLLHHVLLATIQAIRHMALQLPNATKLLLESQGIGKITYLLKLTYTHHNTIAFGLGYDFWKFQHLLSGLITRIIFQRQRKVVGSRPNDSRGKSIDEIILRATTKSIYTRYFYVIALH